MQAFRADEVIANFPKLFQFILLQPVRQRLIIRQAQHLGGFGLVPLALIRPPLQIMPGNLGHDLLNIKASGNAPVENVLSRLQSHREQRFADIVGLDGVSVSWRQSIKKFVLSQEN